jgi:CYTH domain-containing protein
MGMEIERRFLVNGEAWRQQGEALAYVQGYLSVDPERTVRVRIVDQQAWLTLKARVSDASRHEFEYEIPKTEAQTILDVMCSQAISKNRTRVAFAGNIWEVDEFFGANTGLVLAEIELPSENAPFEMPEWLGKEVTADGRFTNAYLADHPYPTWREQA